MYSGCFIDPDLLGALETNLALRMHDFKLWERCKSNYLFFGGFFPTTFTQLPEFKFGGCIVFSSLAWTFSLIFKRFNIVQEIFKHFALARGGQALCLVVLSIFALSKYAVAPQNYRG